MKAKHSRKSILDALRPASGDSISQTPARLSPLQRKIVESAMRGVGDKLIADEVGASHAAVREHWKRILAKLRVHTRVEAAMLVAMDSPRCSPVPQMRDTQKRNTTARRHLRK